MKDELKKAFKIYLESDTQHDFSKIEYDIISNYVKHNKITEDEKEFINNLGYTELLNDKY